MKIQSLRSFSLNVFKLIGFMVVFLGTSLIGSSFVSAANSDSKAVRICERMILSGDRQMCLWQIRGHRFDSRALAVCESIQFDSDKRECLRVIQNKRFLYSQQLRECKNQRFDLDTITCLHYAQATPL